MFWRDRFHDMRRPVARGVDNPGVTGLECRGIDFRIDRGRRGDIRVAVRYLKKATKTPASEEGDARAVVADMLAVIRRGGEAAVLDYARKLDGWQGGIIVTPEEIERRTRDIPAGIRRDIEFAASQVRRFAE